MADLKTNYKDDVLDTSKNEKRKFRMIQNDDGTVSFDDATEYTQQGDAFGAADINATNAKINEQNQSLTNINVNVGEDGKLHFVDSTGADTVLPFKSYDYYTGKSPFTKTFDKKPKSLVAICHTYATLVINGSIKYNQDNKINIDKNFSFYHNNCNGKDVYLVVFDYE